MAFSYRLEDYGRYREQVGEATYIDISRRTDPARIAKVWDNLREIRAAYGAPWVVQLLTKNVAGTLELGRETLARLRAEGTTLTAHVTITGLAGSEWEPEVPVDTVDRLPALAELLGGPDHIKWRYDPIIPTIHTPERFMELARRVASHGVKQGVINFIAPPGRYTRVDRRLALRLPGWAEGMPDYDAAWREGVARQLVALAGEAGIALACCAESADLAERVPGLSRAACGDYAWFVTLSGRDPGRAAFRGSRLGCGCARYFDAGSYGHWARCHRCAYCYAG